MQSRRQSTGDLEGLAGAGRGVGYLLAVDDADQAEAKLKFFENNGSNSTNQGLEDTIWCY